jgi:hypothetical protein
MGAPPQNRDRYRRTALRIGDSDDQPDRYVSRDDQAAARDLDFIAHARQDLPLLLAEVRRTGVIVEELSFELEALLMMPRQDHGGRVAGPRR